MFRLNLQLPGQAAGNIGELLVAMRNAKFTEDLVQAAEEWCQEQGAELLEEVAWLDRYFLWNVGEGRRLCVGNGKEQHLCNLREQGNNADCWRNCDSSVNIVNFPLIALF